LDPRSAAPRPDKAPGRLPIAGRVEAGAQGSVVDGWTGRPIERVPLDERVLARARAFALADHPSLQTVLRVEHSDQTLWLEIPHGVPLDRPLTSDERSCLGSALAALHREGIVHGSVDAAHVMVTPDGSPLLRFASACDPTATVDRDRLALARLGRAG
jgi:hypothetical protein